MVRRQGVIARTAPASETLCTQRESRPRDPRPIEGERLLRRLRRWPLGFESHHLRQYNPLMIKWCQWPERGRHQDAASIRISLNTRSISSGKFIMPAATRAYDTLYGELVVRMRFAVSRSVT